MSAHAEPRMVNLMSSIERFRIALYACALILGVVSFPFVYLTLWGIDWILVLAVVCSCAYHWKQQTRNDKILTNAGRIFFWTNFAARAFITILYAFALFGSNL